MPERRINGFGVVLMYHRVAVHPSDRHRLCVSPAAFWDQMEYLLRLRLHVVPLETLAACARAGRIPDRMVAITFDDGYVDTVVSAMPVLVELGLPATFFIVSDALRPGYEFWWDVLERVFIAEHPLPEMIRLPLPTGTVAMYSRTRAERELAHDTIRDIFYSLSAGRRDEATHRIIEWSRLGDDRDPNLRPVTTEELRLLADAPGMSIGAHTCSHVMLPAQDDRVKRAELGESRSHLEKALGRTVRLFSYPYGGFDASTCSAVAETGFTVAVTTEEGPVQLGDDPLLLPRYDVRGGEDFGADLRRLLGLAV